MAVEIPVYVNISGAFDAAAREVPKEMPKLERAISKNVLNIQVSMGGGMKTIKDALVGVNVSAKELRQVMSDINHQFDRQSQRESANARTSAQVKNLAKAYALVEQRLTGVYNKSTAAGMMVVNTINKVEHKLEELRKQLGTATVGSDAFNTINYQIKIQEDRLRKLNLQYKQYQINSGAATAGVTSSFEKTNSAISKQGGLLRSITSLAATYLSIWQVARFIHNVREVTAEFEMQRVALAGIIQDSERANLLFRQIKAAAIESPFQIKDLVTFTKQLSAYRIETEDLFDVTMKLADVSAGLGVDMNRLVLAYGQVRAASVLRGQELRQFTEAGIPLVELLAKKFTDLNGKMTSTADVFELISKRAVPFEMIAEIFDDMTSAGGTFYKMQERQAETLAGQWANLKDAASIMYDEIGNTDAVHNAMVGVINDAKYLMQNWRSIATILKTVGIQYAAVKVASLFIPKLAFDTELARKATEALARASQLEAAQQARASITRGVAIRQLNAYSAAMAKAAAAQTAFGRGIWKAAAGLAGGGWIALAVTAVSLLTGWLISARKEATRLNRDLEKIGSDGATSINRSVANFNRLAEAAVNAADGSDEQNKALAELQRTYSDIIPSQDLQITKLRELKGNYESLTAAIEQKINMQVKEQKINAATDYYSGKIQRGRKKSKKLLEQYGLDKEQINAVLNEIQREVDNGLMYTGESIAVRSHDIERIIKNLTGQVVSFGSGFRDYEGVWHNMYETNDKTARTLSSLVDTFIALGRETDAIEREMDDSIGTMGLYAKSWDNLKKSIREVTVDEKTFGDKSTFTYKKERIRKQVKEIAIAIQDAFMDTEIDISSAIANGEIDFGALNKFAEEAASKGAFGIDKFVRNAQKSYEAIVPPENMVRVVEQKFKEVANTAGVTMDEVQGYLYRGGNDIRKYVKDLEDSLQSAKDKVAELNITKAQAPSLVSQEQIDNANALVTFLEAIVNWLSDFQKQSKKTPYQQDPFIAQMQNRIKFMQDFKKGYDDLRKYIGDSGALDKELDIMVGRGKSLGIDPEQQKKAAENLLSWYDDMIELVSKKLRDKGVSGLSTADLLGFDTSKKSKAVQDLQKLLQSLWDARTDFDVSEKKRELEEDLKKLSAEIKRSEIARTFFDDILGLTGDRELAESVTVSVYGGVGEDFQDRLQTELMGAFKKIDSTKVGADFSKNLETAIGTMDMAFIRKNLDKIPEAVRSSFESALDASEKYHASWIKDMLKTYEQTKTFEERITDIRKKEAENRDKITKSTDFTEQQKDILRAASRKKEEEDVVEVQVEALKNTEEWITAFEDLDKVGTGTLESLISMLEEFIEKAGHNMNAGTLRSLTKSLEQAREQVYRRNPFAGFKEGLTSYIQELQAAVRARKALAQGDEEAQGALDFSKNNRVKALEKMKSSVDGLTDVFNTLSSAVSSVSELLDFDELSDGKAVLDGLAKGIGTVAVALGLVNTVLQILKVDPIVLAISAAVAAAASLATILSNIKVNRANREIEKQADILEDLEYQYGRLEKAIEKAFGSDYISNYNQQLETLYAKQEAYLKQASAERSKGKKADEDKIKEYENSAREAADSILDMQSQLSEFFSGTDVTSAAKDFANSWIEAYKEYGSTTLAIRQKFQEMVQEMVEKSLAAKVMQQLLTPIFNEIDRLAQEGGELSADDISSIARLASDQIPAINDAMLTLMNTLTQAGYNLRQQPGTFTGISRNIANATEESVNGLTQAMNVNNFYMSYLPNISANVAQIVAIMSGGTAENPATGAVFQLNNELALQYLSALPSINDKMSDVLAILNRLNGAITDKNTSSNFNVIAVRA